MPLPSAAPDTSAPVERLITAEAALTASPQEDVRITPLVAEGDVVAQGAPLLTLRHAPEIVISAPMPGRVAHLDLGPGRSLRRLELFHEPGAGRFDHAIGDTTDPAALRAALLGSGLWRGFRSRPFGHVPLPAETPAAIFVMALDTRPGAPSPARALEGSEEGFAHGLAALTRLVSGKVYLCQPPGADLAPRIDGVTVLRSPEVHPQGLPGIQIHRHCPARPDRRVWDIAAEDVAAIGELLDTGMLRETRLVALGGAAARAPRLVRCQPWADLRGLVQGHVRPGPHVLLSGSALDGRASRWLRPGDRQITAMTPEEHAPGGHWFLSALRRASRPLPLIPSAAVDRALGGDMPAMPFLRALSAGDDEAAIRLGALSLLSEDLALADYVTCAEPRLSHLLAGMLARIEAEGMA
ncbi:Na(+)-translocating NADH-quinone reductase subunit A [Maliponia aquimaris]|uniref:Na(+)-translocating NADH-quinone reductase subunit A n=1 Tax=Maliponia aquimaris TaxID=1673631 RepID=UPI001FE3C774|nr:Na(+)-translocating NADH-quinone reductase subunit A [Maliponia aquimaris]